MQKMTAKQYLRKMYYFRRAIDEKREQLEEFRLLAESTGAIRYDKERVLSSTPQAAGYEDKVARIVDMEHRLLEDIAELTEMYETGYKIIQELEDPIDRLIIEMRYIHHMRFEEIADELNYSVETIYYRHRHALKRLNFAYLQFFTV